MLILTRSEVEELLDLDVLVEAHKSVGVAVQDLAAPARVRAAARERGDFPELELEEISA